MIFFFFFFTLVSNISLLLYSLIEMSIFSGFTQVCEEGTGAFFSEMPSLLWMETRSSAFSQFSIKQKDSFLLLSYIAGLF